MKTRNNNGISVRLLVMILALTLIIGGLVGGTVAWLTATSGPVQNTFTYGDINIDLSETATEFKMVPGNTITKDPKVTVKAGSEACFLFIKVEESDNLDDFITYTIDSGWTELTDMDGVYYREVPAVTADTAFDVLTGNTVSVLSGVTKKQLNDLTSTTQPTLTFTAYAVQQYKNNTEKFTVADAWAKVNS